MNGVQMFDTLTGFKFMAEKKNALEQSGEGKVLFSYEESYGYMMGDYVRDKDAVTAALVCTEMAAWYYGQGMTLYDEMCIRDSSHTASFLLFLCSGNMYFSL